MTAILGVSAFYHDSAATLVVDGEVIAAAQEERFTRIKHDAAFPKHAIQYCLEQAGLAPEQLDYVGYYEKPISKFERLIETYLAYAPFGYRSFRQAMPVWIKEKLHIPRAIRSQIPGFRKRIVFLDHHQSHAASAFFPSPFDDAAILSMDGVGEWTTTCIGRGQRNQIELLDEMRFPHSLGLLYSAFTYYAGFRVNSGEYKLMGLAPYGNPRYESLIWKHLIDAKDDGSFRMNMGYFNFCQGLTMTSPKFHQLFGGPPRKPESEITQHDMDIAASIQHVTEEIVLRMAKSAYRRTGSKNLVLAGGVALNCVANGRIVREGPFEQIWIQPASGDAGGSLGAALFIWHQLLAKPRSPMIGDSQSGSLLGPAYSDTDIQTVLDREGAVYRTLESTHALCQEVARLISEEKIVGWFQGRMEFGPRALGNRSILGDARSPKLQATMNQKIKFRESFRPFAPIVLVEFADTYFELASNVASPYMLLVAQVAQSRRRRLSESEQSMTGLDQRAVARSEIPAVTHIDYSARIQTVDQMRNPLLHQLLSTFRQQTGCPLMINTSFNVRNEPIVCSPMDAYRCFMMTDIDALAIGKQLLLKSDQPQLRDHAARQKYLNEFSLD